MMFPDVRGVFDCAGSRGGLSVGAAARVVFAVRYRIDTLEFFFHRPGPRATPRSPLRMCAAAARLTLELRGRGLTPLEQEFQCKLNVPLGPR